MGVALQTEARDEERQAAREVAAMLPASSKLAREVKRDLDDVAAKLSPRHLHDWGGADWRELNALSWWAGSIDSDTHDWVFSRQTTPHTFSVLVGDSWLTTNKTVLRLIDEADILNLEWADGRRRVPGGIAQTIVPLPGTNYSVLRRRLVKKTLADQMEEWAEPHDGVRSKNRPFVGDNVRASDYKARLHLIGELADTLARFHKDGRVHGDLRPANVSLGDAGAMKLIDYGVRKPPTSLSPEQAIYIAPEASTRTEMASDVYAFGKMAQRIMGSGLWGDVTIGAWRSQELEWLFDFCTLVAPAARPSMEIISKVLHRGPKKLFPSVKHAQRMVRPAMTARLTAAGLTSLEASSAVLRSSEAIHALLLQFPVTGLALAGQQIAESLTIKVGLNTGSIPVQSPVKQDSKKALLGSREVEVLSEFPDDPDGVWRNRLHLANFGTAIDADHDARLARDGDNPNLVPETERYRAQLAVVGEVRRELLKHGPYLSTRGVAELLTNAGVLTSEAEVTVLREWGYLLSVTDHGRHLYPMFQFDERSLPRVIVREVNTRFGTAEPWDVLMWWHQQRPSLNGASFVERIDSPTTADDVRATLTRLGR